MHSLVSQKSTWRNQNLSTCSIQHKVSNSKSPNTEGKKPKKEKKITKAKKQKQKQNLGLKHQKLLYINLHKSDRNLQKKKKPKKHTSCKKSLSSRWFIKDPHNPLIINQNRKNPLPRTQKSTSRQPNASKLKQTKPRKKRIF